MRSMSNVLEYKGYTTKIEYDAEDRVLYGKIEGIKDLVNFGSEYVDEIEQEFHHAVDNYIQMCEEIGRCPDEAHNDVFGEVETDGKTADEMFRALGYKRINPEDAIAIRYRNSIGKQIWIFPGKIFASFIGEKTWLAADEILACAQLINELECR